MVTDFHESFLSFVRLGIGLPLQEIPEAVDWNSLRELAEKHGLAAVVLDGIDKIPLERRPQKKDILQWIGLTIQQESQFTVQQKASIELALLFHENGIRTYVLKGGVVSECYPKPEHRVSTDFDCFLLPLVGDSDVWDAGNDIVSLNGYDVKKDYYKNSTFYIPGLTVENHRFLTPFRGNKSLATLERILQSLLRQDKGDDLFDGTWLYRPPVMVSALFLIEHAYSHFLHEGLTWRHVLDWMLFRKKHEREIDWNEFDICINRVGFKKFYDSFYKLGYYLLGDVDENALSCEDKMMLADVWADLDLHESLNGIRGKLLLAGNTWRARWKYRYFSEISMLHALWIQIKGVLFINEPTLN